MSVVLAFDTATAATVVGLGVGDAVLTRRDDPAPGARPNHAERLLGLCEEVLAEAGAGWGDVSRIGVGIGPGTFTGLRIGVSTGRALAQATGVEVVPVSTLAALAWGAPRPGDQVLTLIDARRGEVFAASWTITGVLLGGPVAIAPDRLADVLQEHDVPVLAIGDGAVRYRAAAEAAGALVPPDEAPEHRVHGHALVQVARAMEPVRPETLVPDYLRLPDAEINRRPAGVRP
jgi:tRNA threonylcarbamoyladenosine biosynthesis protein TsaB